MSEECRSRDMTITEVASSHSYCRACLFQDGRRGFADDGASSTKSPSSSSYTWRVIRFFAILLFEVAGDDSNVGGQESK